MGSKPSYEEIWRRYQSKLNHFPPLRRPRVGAIIKETRIDKGIPQMNFASEVGINLSTLKSIENDHQQATTVGNLSRCAHALKLSVDELILLGRERDPANYFVMKHSEPPTIKGIRKRKRFPQEWYKTLHLPFDDFTVTPISPPLTTQRDFFICRIELAPSRSIEKLALGVHHQVTGFVSAGFDLKIFYEGGKGTPLTAHQGFALDGYFPHSIRNENKEQPAMIYLITKLPRLGQVKVSNAPNLRGLDSLNIAEGIRRIRESKSDRGRLISVKHLADLTDSLDHEQISKLMRVKKGSSVIYWEKIEDLLAATGVSMEEFLEWCHQNEKIPLSVAGAATRATIDYPHHALRIQSAVPLENREFFFGELLIGGKEAALRKNWERKDNAMIAIYIEEGELEATVGRRRSALPILKGESIYFDGSLGYALRNAGSTPLRGFFASYPAIQF